MKLQFCLFFAVEFLFPRRPNLHRITQDLVGNNWIYLSWDQHLAPDNVSSYEVNHTYILIGECSGVVRSIVLTGNHTSFNITGLAGYLNYSINLTAINDAGRSPPNIAFAVRGPAGIKVMYILTTTLIM